ncbi:glycosyltransferase family 4 protein [Acinetobacter variabilis]|uniref:glycosyltransferase family 4 protein n=1 Tax=Acinetobacter variabilis TaxID=70346 RepID=UPI0028AF0543|nr:glycosyltransferase family 1 protein [Acinetobacter variabilis]
MIYINARFLTQPLTGIQRFSIELCKELNFLRNDLVFLVPSISSVLDQSLLVRFNILEVLGGSGHFWEQYTLPKYLNKKGKPLLLNLGNTAPVFYKNKIFTHHDITYTRYPQSYTFTFRNIYKIMTALNYSNSLSFITVSEFSKKDISDFYNVDLDNIHVLYNGVSSEFKLNNSVDCDIGTPFALAVSSPNYHKNFSSLIDAFNKIDNPIALKIIGSSSSVFKNSKIHQTNSKINFLGRVSDNELIELYQNAEFFVFPSLYEGFGIPPLEAQACGCPVISSNAASLPEVLGDSAYYFDPKDINSIRNAILDVVNDPVLRESLRDRGLINVQRFSWQKSALKLNSILSKVQEKLDDN